MGGLNVKITMIERGLQFVAPHPCSNCGKVGAILCDDCKYDIIHEPFVGCILCGSPKIDGICTVHGSPIRRAFIVSSRTGALEGAINQLKFHHAKDTARPLASLLDECLPILPYDIEVVPIPTVRSHIRQRGYDQAELIARHFTVLRGLPLRRYLQRVTNTTQHIVGKSERHQQAKQAFTLNVRGDKGQMRPMGKKILLVDDIVTTGATLQAAAEVLTKAGAIVWVAALAYQPLDEM